MRLPSRWGDVLHQVLTLLSGRSPHVYPSVWLMTLSSLRFFLVHYLPWPPLRWEDKNTPSFKAVQLFHGGSSCFLLMQVPELRSCFKANQPSVSSSSLSCNTWSKAKSRTQHIITFPLCPQEQQAQRARGLPPKLSQVTDMPKVLPLCVVGFHVSSLQDQFPAACHLTPRQCHIFQVLATAASHFWYQIVY